VPAPRASVAAGVTGGVLKYASWPLLVLLSAAVGPVRRAILWPVRRLRYRPGGAAASQGAEIAATGTESLDLARISEYCENEGAKSDDCDVDIIDAIITDITDTEQLQASSAALDFDSGRTDGRSSGEADTVGCAAIRAARVAAEAARCADGTVDVDAFLRFSRVFLPVIDALGPGFRFVTKIVAGNVERLEKQESAESAFYTVPLEERTRNKHLGSSSCAQGVVWLLRSLRFAMDFLRNIILRGEETRFAVQAAHAETLAPYQSGVMRQAFTIATRVLPPRAKVVKIFGIAAETEVESLIGAMKPLLDDLQQWAEAELT
jgi:hypothetical protein